MVFPPSVPSRYRFTACILSFEENFHYMKVKHVLKFVSFETLHRRIEDSFYLKIYENKNYL